MEQIYNIKKILLFSLLYTIILINSSLIYANNINNNLEINNTNELSNIESANNSNSNNLEETNPEVSNINNSDENINISGEAGILIDADSGLILYDKNKDEKLFPASMTKVMTALLTLEYGNLNEKINHSYNSVFNIGAGSSHIGMREGEEITLEQALYAMLLASANEVCMAVAEHISGSVEAFVEKMNEKAKEIGALNTNFTNPHGFHDENHYTTSYDMSLIMKEAIKYDKFNEIINTEIYTIPATNITSQERVLNNTNKMIKSWSEFYYPTIIGGKTGFTNEAGNTLVSYARNSSINLISVVMKCEGTAIYTDTKNLLDYGFSLYKEKEIFNKSDFSSNILVIQKFNDKTIELENIEVVPKDNISKKIPNFIDTTKISIEPELPENIEGPLSLGSKVGTLNLKYNESILASTDLIANKAVEIIPEATLIKKEKIQNFLKTTLKIIKYIIIILIVLIIILIIFSLIMRKLKRNRRKKLRFSNYNKGYYYPRKNNKRR